MVLPLWEGIWVLKEVLETSQPRGLFFSPWATSEWVGLLACGGWARQEEVRGGWWAEPCDSHSGNSHLASRLPSPQEKGGTPGAQKATFQGFPCKGSKIEDLW